jgi:hypothetical protein
MDGIGINLEVPRYFFIQRVTRFRKPAAIRIPIRAADSSALFLAEYGKQT